MSWSRPRPSLIAACAQLASGTRPATETPGVQLNAAAKVAGVGFRSDQFDQGCAPKLLRQAPACRLINPHEWRFDTEGPIHAEAKRQLHGQHCFGPTIWVA